MPAIASVILVDSVAANRTFVPSSIDSNGVARLFEAGAIYDARLSLSASLRLPINGSKVARVQYKLSIPVMNTVDANQKDGEVLCSVEFVIPKIASITDRDDIRFLAADLLTDNLVVAMVRDLEGVY